MSYLPHAGFAAASTAVLVFSVVVMPAFAMLTVCCSMTCARSMHGENLVKVVGPVVQVCQFNSLFRGACLMNSCAV